MLLIIQKDCKRQDCFSQPETLQQERNWYIRERLRKRIICLCLSQRVFYFLVKRQILIFCLLLPSHQTRNRTVLFQFDGELHGKTWVWASIRVPRSIFEIRGAPLVTRYWKGTRLPFLLNLYISENIGGHVPPPPPHPALRSLVLLSRPMNMNRLQVFAVAAGQPLLN